MIKNLLLIYFLVFAAIFHVFGQSQQVTLTPSSPVSIAENNGSLTITGTINGTNSSTFNLPLRFAVGGTATSGKDYSIQFPGSGVSIAAGGNGQGSASNQFNGVFGIYPDSNGDLYVCDRYNGGRIQKFTFGNPNAVTVLSGLNGPTDVYVDANKNLYVLENGLNRLSRFDLINGAYSFSNRTTIAGGSSGNGDGQLSAPEQFFVKGDFVYINDRNNYRIQKWPLNPDGLSIGTTVAGGNGRGRNLNQLTKPNGIWVDDTGNLYVGDHSDDGFTSTRLIKFPPESNRNTNGVEIITHNPAPGNLCCIHGINGVAGDKEGNIYFAEGWGQRVFKLPKGGSQADLIRILGKMESNNSSTGVVGSELNSLNNPYDVAMDIWGNVFVSDQNNYRVTQIQYGPQIIIAPGASSGSFSIKTEDDASFESTESITLSMPLDQLQNSGGSYTVNITDNDQKPKLVISASSNEISEGSSGQIEIRATPEVPVGLDAIITLSVSGTATKSVDYQFSGLFAEQDNLIKIKIPAGASFGSAFINTNCNSCNDVLVEPLENIILTVTSVENVQPNSDILQLTIKSDDKPTFVITSSGSPMEENGSAAVTATLEAKHSSPVFIDFSISGTASNSKDYKINQQSNISIVAGGNNQGNGLNQLNFTQGITTDRNGNLYVADIGNNRIMKWTPGASEGEVLIPFIEQPSMIQVVYNDPKNEVSLFISNRSGSPNANQVTKWTLNGQFIKLVAGANTKGAELNQLNEPEGFYTTVDASGNETTYVADTGNKRIVKWVQGATTGQIIYDATKSNLTFSNQLRNIVVDQEGVVYFTATDVGRIFRIKDGKTTEIVSNFDCPWGIAINPLDNRIYFGVACSNSIRVWDPQTEKLLTGIIMGGASGGALNQFRELRGIHIDWRGNIYATDWGNFRIQKLQVSPQITIPAGDLSASINFTGIEDAIDEDDETIVINADAAFGGILTGSTGLNQVITIKDFEQPLFSLSTNSGVSPVSINEDNTSGVEITAKLSGPSRKEVQISLGLSGDVLEEDFSTEFTSKGPKVILSGNATTSPIQLFGLADVFIDDEGTLYLLDNSRILRKTLEGSWEVLVERIGENPRYLYVESATKDIFVSLHNGSNERSFRVIRFKRSANYSENFDVDYSTMTVAGGNGRGPAANQLDHPTFITGDKDGNIYVNDQNNNRVQKWAPGAKEGITVAPKNGSGPDLAQLNGIMGLELDSDNNLYIADKIGRVVKWAPGATVGELVFNIAKPAIIRRTKSGDFFVLTGEWGDSPKLWKWSKSNGSLTLIAENFANPNHLLGSVAVDKFSNPILATTNNELIKIQTAPEILIPAGSTSGSVKFIPVDDKIDENDETANIIPVTFVNAKPSSSDQKAIIKIIDNDNPPVLNLNATEQTIREGSSAPIEISMAASTPSGKDITLTIKVGGSAIRGKDYIMSNLFADDGSSVKVRIPADELGSKFLIKTDCPSCNNTLVEPVKTIELEITEVMNATLDSLKYQFSLESDDKPKVWLETTSTKVDEGAVVQIKAASSDIHAKDVIIDLEMSGEASFGYDYEGEFLTKGVRVVAAGNGSGFAANQINNSQGVSTDREGNIYVADSGNGRIVRWNPGARSGQVLVNNLPAPSNVAIIYNSVTKEENMFVVTRDSWNSNGSSVIKYTLSGQFIAFVAGNNGQGSELNQLNGPEALAVYVDVTGNEIVYVADTGNNRIVRWSPGAKAGVAILGGENSPVSLSTPRGVTTDGQGNVYVGDQGSGKVYFLKGGIVTPVVQNTQGQWNIAFDTKNQLLYIAEEWGNKVTQYNVITEELTTVMGGGQGSRVNQFNNVRGLHVDRFGNVYATDYFNYRVQKLQRSFQITIPAGQTTGSLTLRSLDDDLDEEDERLNLIAASVVEGELDETKSKSSEITIVDFRLPQVQMTVSENSFREDSLTSINLSIPSPSTKDIFMRFSQEGTALAFKDYEFDFPEKGIKIAAGGLGGGSNSDQLNNPLGVVVDDQGNLFVADERNSRIQRFAPGSKIGKTVISGFNCLRDVAVDSKGRLFAVEACSNRVVRFDPKNGTYSWARSVLVAGTGTKGSDASQLANPAAVTIRGEFLFVADQENHRIQKWPVEPTAEFTGITVAGGNGSGSGLDQLSWPSDCFIDLNGNYYVSDNTNNGRILKFPADSKKGTSGVLLIQHNPPPGNLCCIHGVSSVTGDDDGNIYFSEGWGQRVFRLPSNGSNIDLQRIAGKPDPNGTTGISGSDLSSLSNPTGLYSDKIGNLWISDSQNNRIIRILKSPLVVIPAGETKATLSVVGIDEDVNEADEVLSLKISAISNATAPSDALSLTVLDNTRKLTLKESPFIGLSKGAVAWGDYDRDGDQDVAIMGQSATQGAVTALFENKSGTFVNTNIDFLRMFEGDITWSDINKDGWIDLIVTGFNNGPQTKVYMNMEGKYFEPDDNTGLPKLFSSKMAFGDLDNDGDSDFAISGITDKEQFQFLVYMQDNKTKKFIQENGFSGAPFINGDLKIADYNLDGDNDIIYSGVASSGDLVGAVIPNSLIRTNNESPSNPPFVLPAKGSSIIVSDIVGVKPIILVSGEDKNKTNLLYSIGAEFPNLPKLRNGDLAAGDFNNDGLKDIVLTGESASGEPVTKLFIQKGCRQFTGSEEELKKCQIFDFKESDLQISGLRESTANWVDYDKDGDLDLFISGIDKDGVAKTLLYEAELRNKINQAPGKIQGLKTTDLGNGRIRFSWDAPKDDYSRSIGYVLRLGTTPGGSELSNTESNLQTGDRLITKAPPIYGSSFETQLDPGTYYWSVQGVDSGLKGGLFADEASFSLTYEWKILNQGGIVDRSIGGLNNPVIKFGDIDNDTDMDLFYGSATDQNLRLYVYENGKLVDTGWNPFNNINRVVDAEVGDINGDGKMDVLINNFSNDNTFNFRLFFSKPDGSYENIEQQGLYRAKGLIKDLNNDGKAEVVITGLSSSTVAGVPRFFIYEFVNNQLTKVDVSSQIAQLKFASFDLGDFDKDQDVDFIISGFNDTNGLQTVVYKNTTTLGGAFKLESFNSQLPGVRDGTTDFLDFDGDGDLDIVISGTSATGDIFNVYLNQINENKNEWPRISLGLSPVRNGKIDLGDFNGDGYSDLLYSGLAQGTGRVTKLAEFDPVSKTYRESNFDVSDILDAEVEFGDFDGDGDLDFALSGESSTSPGNFVFRAFVNVRNQSAAALATSAGSRASGRESGDINLSGGFKALNEDVVYFLNEPPKAPKLIEAKNLGENAAKPGFTTVLLSWEAAIDDQTPKNGLTYALRVGTTDGGEQIMSADANINGQRKTAGKGNVEHNLKWKLSLPAGNYYWAVQAIDASYAGSAFSESGYFVVSATGTIAKQQSIEFPEFQSKSYGDQSFELAATASSGLPVTFVSSNPDVATVTGKTVTIKNAGIAEISAKQDGNTSFSAAATVKRILEVKKAVLNVTVESKERFYGEENPAFTFIYAGFRNNETATVLNSAPVVSTPAVKESSAGTYPIILSGGSDDNYELKLVAGTLEIKKALLNVKAEDKTRLYGTDNPELTIVYEGFKLNQTKNVLDVPPVVSTTATKNSDVGKYPIIVSSGSDDNYDLRYQEGTLSIVGAQAQTLTFQNLTDQTEKTGTFELSAVASSGLTVVYSTKDTEKIKIEGNKVTILKPGKVTITASQSGNNSFAPTETSQTICINPNPPVITTSGNNVPNATLSSSASSGNQWFFNGTAISGATGKELPASESGTYKVQTSVEGCLSSFSDDFVLIITSIANKDLTIAAEIFPNPGTDQFRLRLNSITSRPELQVEILDLTGRTVHRQMITKEETIIDTSEWAKGTYLIRLNGKSVNQIRKFIKM